MKLAFLILVHKEPKQVNILIEQLLSNKNSYIYIHISKEYRNDIQYKLLKDSRVKILDTSIKIEWSNDGILKAQLLLLENALRDKMEYITFLTGQDLVIKSDFAQYIEENKEEIFLNAVESKKEARTRLEYYWNPHFLKLYDKNII